MGVDFSETKEVLANEGVLGLERSIIKLEKRVLPQIVELDKIFFIQNFVGSIHAFFKLNLVGHLVSLASLVFYDLSDGLCHLLSIEIQDHILEVLHLDIDFLNFVDKLRIDSLLIKHLVVRSLFAFSIYAVGEVSSVDFFLDSLFELVKTCFV